MRVPNAIRAYTGYEKVHDYLLDPLHPDGRGKCQFFTMADYSRLRWRQLAADLQRHVRTKPVARETATPFGRKYVVRGSLRVRTGRVVNLVSVWMLRTGEEIPRLVTAYPEDSTR
jgi:hypothetical protein